ncbi:MAG: hypothetical protein IIC24_12635 [Chloroflexi bacterium]|nr:hypothetical protein [Chloroflexota bacterium]
MKHDEDYNLGDPPDYLKVIDVRGNDVKGVELEPGVRRQPVENAIASEFVIVGAVPLGSEGEIDIFFEVPPKLGSVIVRERV